MTTHRKSKARAHSKSAYCKQHKKRRFPDKKSADRALRAFTANRNLGVYKPNHQTPVRAYLCPDCNGYHLTSNP